MTGGHFGTFRFFLKQSWKQRFFNVELVDSVRYYCPHLVFSFLCECDSVDTCYTYKLLN